MNTYTDPRQYRTNARSVLRPEYLSSSELTNRRVNTNTAPIYSDAYNASTRTRRDRFATGQSYSVIRSQYVNNQTFMFQKHLQSEENRSKQPGHNQTEQLRRSREMDMFKDIGFNFENEYLKSVRCIYSDKRSSGTQNNLRVTKKVNLSSTHSVVRAGTRHTIRLLYSYQRELLKRLLVRMNEKVTDAAIRKLLLRLVKTPTIPCTPNCSACQRLVEGSSSLSYPTQNYNGNGDKTCSNTSVRYVGSTVSGTRHFALPPENGPCPMAVRGKIPHRYPSPDMSPLPEPRGSSPTAFVESFVEPPPDALPPDDVISSSSSCCNSL